MYVLCSGMSLSSNSAAKTEKQKAAIQEDLKYLYSAFTKVPCLRLAPDHKARLIAGFEEFPFDTAVPLFAFKNVSALEICDVDFRQFSGWERMSEQLRSLTVKRAGLEDPKHLLTDIVLDDMEKRRRRSTKGPPSPTLPQATSSPKPKRATIAVVDSTPPSPAPVEGYGSLEAPGSVPMSRGGSNESHKTARRRHRSSSPMRPGSARFASSNNFGRASTPNIRRSSGSSTSSMRSSTPRGSTSNLFALGILPPAKWRFLKHLSLADNALHSMTASSLSPVADSLQSFDLSSNLLTEIPDSLSTLTSLRALNLSNCMIESLHSLARNPLPAITTLNLRGNRLSSLAGVHRLLSLERIDVRDNRLTDPTELARLTGLPNITELYVNKNPFVKTHPDYRVTIFNLFRKTPGYTEDILIDSTGPTYAERKLLVDRVPESASVPVMRPVPEDIVPAEPAMPIAPPSGEIREVGPPRPSAAMSPRRTQSERGAVSSQRRRKAPKRQIVELSQNESPLQSYAPAMQSPALADEGYLTGDTGSPKPRKPSITPRALQRPAQEQQPPLLDTNTLLPSPSIGPDTAHPLHSPDFDISADMYKKKIEALKNDFGNNWLSALHEESFDTQRHTQTRTASDSQFSPTVRPTNTSTMRSPSTQGIVSGGRTLG